MTFGIGGVHLLLGWIIITIKVGVKRVGTEVCVGKQHLQTRKEFIQVKEYQTYQEGMFT